jgi:putative transposase
MPNHVHGIIIIHQSKRIGLLIVGATRRVAPTQRPTGPSSGSLGAIMAQFKSIVTKRINELRNTPGTSVWQRNYYEHVIRNEDDFSRVREYLINNPTLWEEDENNPEQIALTIGSGGKHGKIPSR